MDPKLLEGTMGEAQRVSRTTWSGSTFGREPVERQSAPPEASAVQARRTLRIPPPPPPSAPRSTPPVQPAARTSQPEAPATGAIASVRLDRAGEIIASFGQVELLAQLVAYVGRLASLLSAELGLDPFQALHAELMGMRVVMFADGSELVGLLLEPGAEAQLLRQRLGV